MSVLPDYLEGAVDLHVHSAPDIDQRRFNDLELARAAKDAGVGAVLIKSHQNSTVERAWLVSQCVPGIRVCGGLVLNETVGGLTPPLTYAAHQASPPVTCYFITRIVGGRWTAPNGAKYQCL